MVCLRCLPPGQTLPNMNGEAQPVGIPKALQDNNVATRRSRRTRPVDIFVPCASDDTVSLQRGFAH